MIGGCAPSRSFGVTTSLWIHDARSNRENAIARSFSVKPEETQPVGNAADPLSLGAAWRSVIATRPHAIAGAAPSGTLVVNSGYEADVAAPPAVGLLA
jgi:hypothetical protein